MPVKNMPPVWRDSVQVVLRMSTSISPEARIVGRSLALIGRNLNYLGIVENCRGDRPALIDVETFIDPLVVRQAETGEARIGAADQLAPRLDLIERAGGGRKSGSRERRPGKPSNKRSHDNLLIDAKGSGRSREATRRASLWRRQRKSTTSSLPGESNSR